MRLGVLEWGFCGCVGTAAWESVPGNASVSLCLSRCQGSHASVDQKIPLCLYLPLRPEIYISSRAEFKEYIIWAQS